MKTVDVKFLDNNVIRCSYDNNNTLEQNSILFKNFDNALNNCNLFNYAPKQGYSGGNYGDGNLTILFTKRNNLKTFSDTDALTIYSYINEK